MPTWKCRFGSLGAQGHRGRAALDPTVPGITWAPPPRLLSLPAPLPSRSRLYVPGINPLYSGFVSGGRQRVCSQTRSGAEAEGSHGRGNTCISRYLSGYKYIHTKYMHPPNHEQTLREILTPNCQALIDLNQALNAISTYFFVRVW